MAIITLSVDTSQARAALNGVNQAITQIKVNGSTISIGGTQVTGELKQIGQEAQKTKDILTKAATEPSKHAVGAIKAVSKEFKSGVGWIKSFSTGMVSWWTALILAVEAATKTFTYFFNNLTESIPKLNQKMDNLNTQVKKNYQNWKNEKKATDQYSSSLNELAKKQSLTNTEQVLAQALIDKLNQKYKGLNISIDGTTGAVKGYTQALRQMDKQDAEAEKNLIRKQINAKREQVDARLAETFGTDKVSLANADANKMFSSAENWFGDINETARKQISLAWNSGDNNAKLKILNDLATRYENNQAILKTINGAITALEELIGLQKQFGDLSDANNIILNNAKKILEESRDIIKQTADLNDEADKIYESIAKDQEQTAFDNLGSEQQKIQFLEERIQKLQEQERTLNSQAGQLESKDSNVEAISATSQSLKAQIQDDNKSIDELRNNIAEAKREYEKQTGRSFVGRPIKAIQDQLDKVMKNRRNPTKNALYGQDYKNQIRELQAQLKAAEAINKANKKIKETQDQINSLNQQLTQNENKYADAIKGGLVDQQQLASIKKQQAEINKEIYDKQKQQDKLRDAIAGKEVKTLEEEQQARKKLAEAEADLAAKRKETSRNFFQSGRDSQLTQYLKLIGKQREALILEQKINLARALGLKSIKELSEAQNKGIERQVDLQMKLDQLSKMGNINAGRPEIITNELARKGGFASSVVIERNNINKNILTAAQQQVNLQNAIKSEISKYGVIQ